MAPLINGGKVVELRQPVHDKPCSAWRIRVERGPTGVPSAADFYAANALAESGEEDAAAVDVRHRYRVPVGIGT
jgi:hypothetical protein